MVATNSQLVGRGEGRFALSGELNFDTVPGILRESEREFANQRELSIDLAEVTKANSAGMALLLEWRSRARSNGLELSYSNVPKSIQQIAKVCDVDLLIAD